MVSERRHHQRVTVDSLVPVDLGRDNGGILINLSEGGLRIRAVGRLETDQVVNLGFSLLGKNNRIETCGQIAWVDESATGGAVRFLDLPESARKQIRQWMPHNAPTAGIQQEAIATQSEATESESYQSSPAHREATSWVPSWAETDATTQEKPRVPPASPYAGTDAFGFTASGNYQAKESQAVLSQPVDPWLKDEWKAKSPAREPKVRRQLVQGTIAGCLVVLILIAGLILYRSQRERIGDLVGDIRRTIVGESAPPETSEPAPATVSSTKPRPRPRSRSKDQLTEEGRASSASAPSRKSRPSQLEVLESNNQRRLIKMRGGPIVRVKDWSTGGRVRVQTEDLATTGAPASAPLATTPAQRAARSQAISGGLLQVQEMPEYPELAMQNNLQGTVLLRAVVGKDGRVQDILLISGPPMLASAVLDAVRKWRYKPYYRNGEPVEVETQIKVDFSITPQ
jgi:TonB family protein